MKAAAIGTFDGVHLGHRSVLKKLTDHAQKNGLQPLAITFTNHPLALIAPERIPTMLTPLWKKKNLLKEVGVTPLVLDFDEDLRSVTAAEWMKKLKEEFNIEAIVIGYDNTFGCDGVNMSLDDYRKIGENIGMDVITADEVKGVSSSAIRKAVAAGEMEKAQEMLGRPYSITAKVIKGNSLGHTIGFPTANISLPEGMTLPKLGVYAAIVKTLEDGKKYPAMVNIGTRPTVMRGNETVIEAHIINWKGDLYGKDITVRFIHRLRDEEKFESIEALKKQLSQDKAEVLNLIQ